MKDIFLAALAAAILGPAACATTLYSTSDSGAISGGAFGYAGYVDDYVGSSGIESDFLGSTSTVVDFSFQVALPDNPEDLLSSALFTLTGSVAQSASGYDYSDGSQGTYISGEYGCGFFNEDTCYDYSSNYNAATVNTSGYYGGIVLTEISSSATTWNGDLTAGDSVDLLTFGFGSDLVAGGTLTLSGYVPVTADITGVDYDGFNAYTDFEPYYDIIGNASASLTLSGAVAPEPGTSWLLFGGLGILLVASYLKRSRLVSRLL